MEIRHAHPSDYGRVIQHVNAWWGGRDMAPMLPKLFFLHFEGTSFVAENDDGTLAAFLIGFLSQTDSEEAYIHFVGVAPDHRGSGIGRELYERFFTVAAAQGRTRVRCVTSPVNEGSIAFHESLGFTAESVAKDYDGPGEDRVLFVKQLCRLTDDGPHTGFTEPRLVSAGCRTSFSRRPGRPADGAAAGPVWRSCSPSSSWSWLRLSAAWRCPSARRSPPGRRSAGSTSVG